MSAIGRFLGLLLALGSLIPALLSGRINNRAVKQQLLNEENA